MNHEAFKISLLPLLLLLAGPSRAEEYQVGDAVECNWKNSGTFYPGRIAKREGDQVFIDYNDGDQEYTQVDKCRLRNKSGSPSGAPRQPSKPSAETEENSQPDIRK